MKKLALIFFTMISVNTFSKCKPKDLVFKANNQLEIETSFYETIGSERLVVILPPTGGENFIDRSYAKAFCGTGMSAIIIKNWTENFDITYDLNVHTDYYKTAHEAIDYVLEQFESHKIGIFGTSLGAIHGSIAFARNDSVDSAFFVVGGGNLTSIIANSDQTETAAVKKIRFEKFGYKTIEEYENALKNHLPYEMLDIEFNRANKKIGMSISLNDTTVPTHNQLLLKEKWEPDVLYTSKYGHEGTVVKTWLIHKRKIVNFFLR